MRSISIVIPAYNEEECIPTLFALIKEIVPGITDDFEVIVVDDASEDTTPLVLDNAASLDPRIKVVHNKKNRKLGGTLREGFKKATKELVLYFDADQPFDLKEIRTALRLLEENADFVTAYRTNRNIDGPRRLLYSTLYNWLLNFLFHIKIKDVNFSFKLFKRDILENIKLDSEGSFISAELLIKSTMAGFRIAQFPVTYLRRNKGRSTLSTPPVILKILQELSFFYLSFFIWYTHLDAFGRGIWMHFQDAPLFRKIYVYLRLKTCPFERIEKYVPDEGAILDLGCGYGLFSVGMCRRLRERNVTAVDWSTDRINYAKAICRDSGIKINFVRGDINQLGARNYDAIIIIDVLYLYPRETQKEILARCLGLLNPGGTLIVKEMDTAARLKFAWCYSQEWISTKILKRNIATGLHFFRKEHFDRWMDEAGFNTEIKRLDTGYFYPHTLYVCKKKSDHNHLH